MAWTETGEVLGNVDTKMVDRLRESRYWAIPRIIIDLVLWIGALAIAVHSRHNSWAVVGAILCIGAIAMHDLLVQGHEGVHGMIARRQWVNEFFTWLTHAAVGFSGTAYQTFHLDHHRYVQTERDPEYRLLNRVVMGAPGWAYLLVPCVFHVAMNTYPMRTRGHRNVVPNVIRDLVGMAALHIVLAMGLGISTYALFVIVPIATSFAWAMIVQTICEHHGTQGGNHWTNTRTTITTPILSWLWSNVNYHHEHHLFPFIPFHQLPQVRCLLAEEFNRRGAVTDYGYLRTSARLIREPHHILPVGSSPVTSSVTAEGYMVRERSLAFRAKVAWFGDILRSPRARKHLWNLYYAGEAYEELHPQGVFISLLPPPLDQLLKKHLSDENRHAEIFRGLLQAEGESGPASLSPEQDIGWHLLTHILPDVVEKGAREIPFDTQETMRYMAFLHALELRSISDLCALLVAARQRGETQLVEKIISILRDERFHATYTHDFVFRLATNARQARSVIDCIRKAERKYYTDSLKHILAHFERLGTQPPSVIGRLRWMFMKLVAKSGGAVSLLPVYDRIPSRVMVGVAI